MRTNGLCRSAARSSIISLIFVAVHPFAALALDCAKAVLPVEKAICADPEADASDRAMETAFKTYRAPLLGDARQSALDDQRAWLLARNETCTVKRGDRIRQEGTEARCVENKNRARTRILLGHPEAGSGLTRSPTPLFVRRTGGRKRFEVEVRVYRFDAPMSPGETLINDQAERALRDVPERLDEASDIDIDNASYYEVWTIVYGSERLVSFEREQWEYSGGAHGMSWTTGLNVDLTKGERLDIGNTFDAKAMSDLDRVCFGQLAEKMDLEPMKYDDADSETVELRQKIKSGMTEANAWTFGMQGATIRFGDMNGYAAGPYECVIPFERLDPLAKHPYR